MQLLWVSFQHLHSMNRVIILFFLIGTTTSLQSQTRANFSNALKIEFIYGDEAYTREELHFEIRDNKVIGKITYPNTNKVISSEVELTDSQTNTINSFISLVEQYKSDNCVEKNSSSYVQYYFITKDNEKIEIRKFCDRRDLTFFDIKQLIFKNYLKSLELKKHSLELEYFKVLKGKWKEKTPLDKLGLTSICDLTKLDESADTSDYVKFTELNKVVIQRKNRKISYSYHLVFRDENTYIYLEPYQNGTEFIYGHRFLIIESNSKKMKLSRG